MATEADLVAQIAVLEAGLTPEKRITKGDRTTENHDLDAINKLIAAKKLELAAVRRRKPSRQVRAIAGSGC